MSTSPGLLVKTYLQKLSEIIVWINKTVINKGNWFFDPLKIIMIKPIILISRIYMMAIKVLQFKNKKLEERVRLLEEQLNIRGG